jgi:hypothetical protein
MKMICPKSETCKSGKAYKCGHIRKHNENCGCGFEFRNCPACVPVKEVKPKKEK